VSLTLRVLSTHENPVQKVRGTACLKVLLSLSDDKPKLSEPMAQPIGSLASNFGKPTSKIDRRHSPVTSSRHDSCSK